MVVFTTIVTPILLKFVFPKNRKHDDGTTANEGLETCGVNAQLEEPDRRYLHMKLVTYLQNSMEHLGVLTADETGIVPAKALGLHFATWQSLLSP